jgi:hypothetical protein
LIGGQYFDPLIATSRNDDRHPGIDKSRSCPSRVPLPGETHDPTRSQHCHGRRFVANLDG